MYKLRPDPLFVVGGWDVSNVIDMWGMFYEASSFNQDIGSWNVSNVIDMGWMFGYSESFNQNLSDWCVAKISQEPEYFDIGADAWVLPDSRPIWGTCP